MRDLETIRLALTAAETGHLVFGFCIPPLPPKPSTVSSTFSPEKNNGAFDVVGINACGYSQTC